MFDASSNRHRKPIRVIACITLVAFLFTSIPADLIQASETTSRSINATSFSLPRELGTVQSSWSSSKLPTIIHIQDAHCNYNAQRKIAEIIGYLNKTYGIDTVNLEGGKGDYDLSIFKAIADNSRRQQVADRFAREGLINGAEYFAATNLGKVMLWGIEDDGLYLENLRIYRQSLRHKDEIDKYLRTLSRILSNLKAHIYSTELLEFDAKYSQHKAGNLEFKTYVSAILELAKRRGISIERYGDLTLLSQVIEKESGIDFAKANSERDQLIDVLRKALSNRETAELLQKTVEFSSGKMPQAAYYAYIQRKTKEVAIDTGAFPDFRKYLIYIERFGNVDNSKVMDEVADLEKDIRTSLCENDSQRELDTLSRNLAVTRNIFNVTLTRNDYRYYMSNESSFSTARYASFINREAPRYKVEAELGPEARNIDLYREEISKFYELSMKRDDAFMRNLRFQSPDNRVAIIVTGGFHGENLCELFKKNGMSYVSILPNFRIENGYESPYFKLLAGNPYAEFIKTAQSLGLSALAIASNLNQLGKQAAVEAGMPLSVERSAETIKLAPTAIAASLLGSRPLQALLLSPVLEELVRTFVYQNLPGYSALLVFGIVFTALHWVKYWKEFDDRYKAAMGENWSKAPPVALKIFVISFMPVATCVISYFLSLGQPSWQYFFIANLVSHIIVNLFTFIPKGMPVTPASLIGPAVPAAPEAGTALRGIFSEEEARGIEERLVKVKDFFTTLEQSNLSSESREAIRFVLLNEAAILSVLGVKTVTVAGVGYFNATGRYLTKAEASYVNFALKGVSANLEVAFIERQEGAGELIFVNTQRAHQIVRDHQAELLTLIDPIHQDPANITTFMYPTGPKVVADFVRVVLEKIDLGEADPSYHNVGYVFGIPDAEVAEFVRVMGTDRTKLTLVKKVIVENPFAGKAGSISWAAFDPGSAQNQQLKVRYEAALKFAALSMQTKPASYFGLPTPIIETGGVSALIERYIPQEYRARFDAPNLPMGVHVHDEGGTLKHHLQAMLNVLDSAASLPIPEQYKALLADKKHRKFFELFILLHDIGKDPAIKDTVVEEGRSFELYPKHEAASAAFLEEHPELLSDPSIDRDVLREVIRLHGALYAVSQKPTTKEGFEEFVAKNQVKGDIRIIAPLLVAADLLDVYGTHRQDPWIERPLNFAHGYEEYLAWVMAAGRGPSVKIKNAAKRGIPLAIAIATTAFMTAFAPITRAAQVPEAVTPVVTNAIPYSVTAPISEKLAQSRIDEFEKILAEYRGKNAEFDKLYNEIIGQRGVRIVFRNVNRGYPCEFRMGFGESGAIYFDLPQFSGGKSGEEMVVGLAEELYHAKQCEWVEPWTRNIPGKWARGYFVELLFTSDIAITGRAAIEKLAFDYKEKIREEFGLPQTDKWETLSDSYRYKRPLDIARLIISSWPLIALIALSRYAVKGIRKLLRHFRAGPFETFYDYGSKIKRRPAAAVNINDIAREARSLLEPEYKNVVRFELDSRLDDPAAPKAYVWASRDTSPNATVSEEWALANVMDLIRMSLANALYFKDRPDLSITVRTFIADDGRLAVSISDNGPGMDFENIKAVVLRNIESGYYRRGSFDIARVKRGDKKYLMSIFTDYILTTKPFISSIMVLGKKESQGRGMALGSMREIIRESKGALRLVTQEGAGTAITFLFRSEKQGPVASALAGMANSPLWKALVFGSTVFHERFGHILFGRVDRSSYTWRDIFNGRARGVSGWARGYGGLLGNVIGLGLGIGLMIVNIILWTSFIPFILPEPVEIAIVLGVPLYLIFINIFSILAELIADIFNVGDIYDYEMSRSRRLSDETEAARFEIGSSKGSFGDMIDGGKSTSRTGASSREKLVVDTYKDTVLRDFYAKFIRGFNQRLKSEIGAKAFIRYQISRLFGRRSEVKLPGSVKGGLIRLVYDTVLAMVAYDADYVTKDLEAKHKGEWVLLGDASIAPGKGVCRHQGLIAAYVLERLITSGILRGQVYYRRYYNHGWAEYRDSGGKYHVIDIARKELKVNAYDQPVSEEERDITVDADVGERTMFIDQTGPRSDLEGFTDDYSDDFSSDDRTPPTVTDESGEATTESATSPVAVAPLQSETPSQAAATEVPWMLASNEKAGDHISRYIVRKGYFVPDSWGPNPDAIAIKRHQAMLDVMLEDPRIAYEENGVAFILIEDLLEDAGQLAHIGFGQTYGRKVVYIDKRFAHDKRVEDHEFYEIELWERFISDEAYANEVWERFTNDKSYENEPKNLPTGISLGRLRPWMKKNQKFAVFATKQFHKEANDKYGVEDFALRNMRWGTASRYAICGNVELESRETPSQAAAQFVGPSTKAAGAGAPIVGFLTNGRVQFTIAKDAPVAVRGWKIRHEKTRAELEKLFPDTKELSLVAVKDIAAIELTLSGVAQEEIDIALIMLAESSRLARGPPRELACRLIASLNPSLADTIFGPDGTIRPETAASLDAIEEIYSVRENSQSIAKGIVDQADRMTVPIDIHYPLAQEEMVNVKDLGLDYDSKSARGNPRGFYIRKSLADKLQGVDRRLKAVGWHIQVTDGFRSLREQQRKISAELEKDVRQHSLFRDKDAARIARVAEWAVRQDDHLRTEARAAIDKETKYLKNPDGVWNVTKNVMRRVVINDIGLSENEFEAMLNILIVRYYGFSNPEPTAPHISGGAVDVVIIDTRTGEQIPTKYWQFARLHGKTPKEIEALRPGEERALQEAYKIIKNEGGYQDLEDYKGPFKTDVTMILKNRRILYYLMKKEGFEPNKGEFWHFDMGNTAAAFRTHSSAYYGMCVAENALAELFGFDNATEAADTAKKIVAEVESKDVSAGARRKAAEEADRLVGILKMESMVAQGLVDMDSLKDFLARAHEYFDRIAIPAKGILVSVERFLQGFGIDTKTPAMENFWVPVIEEGIMFFFLSQFGVMAFLGTRTLFVLLHTIQDRAPPAGTSRTLYEKIAIPLAASIAAGFFAIASTNISYALIAGLFTHVLGNTLVDAFGWSYQKGAVSGPSDKAMNSKERRRAARVEAKRKTAEPIQQRVEAPVRSGWFKKPLLWLSLGLAVMSTVAYFIYRASAYRTAIIPEDKTATGEILPHEMRGPPKEEDIREYAENIAKTRLTVEQWVKDVLADNTNNIIMIGDTHVSTYMKELLQVEVMPGLEANHVSVLVIEHIPYDMQPMLDQFNNGGPVHPALRDYVAVLEKANHMPLGTIGKILVDARNRGIKLYGAGTSLKEAFSGNGEDPKFRIKMFGRQRDILIDVIKDVRKKNPGARIAAFMGNSHNDDVKGEVRNAIAKSEPVLSIDMLDVYCYTPAWKQTKNSDVEKNAAGEWRGTFLFSRMIEGAKRAGVDKSVWVARPVHREYADWVIYIGEHYRRMPTVVPKGILVSVESFLQGLGIDTKTPATENFWIPAIEEGMMFFFLSQFGVMAFLGARTLFVLLHAIQDRAPPAGTKRTLYEKIAIPLTASIAASFFAIASTNISYALIAGLFTHMLGNTLIDILDLSYQKGVLRSQPERPQDISLPATAFYRTLQGMLAGRILTLPAITTEMTSVLMATQEGRELLYNYERIEQSFKYLFVEMNAEERQIAFSFVQQFVDKMSTKDWTLNNFEDLSGMRALFRNLLIAAYNTKDVNRRFQRIVRGMAYGVGLFPLIMEHAICVARLHQKSHSDFERVSILAVPDICAPPESIDARRYNAILSTLVPHYYTYDAKVRFALAKQILHKMEPEGSQMVAYTAPELPYVVKVMKRDGVNNHDQPLDFERDIVPGTYLARTRLGGLAANVHAMRNVKVKIGDRDAEFGDVLIQTKTMPLRNKFEELAQRGGPEAEKEARRILRKWWELQVAMWRRGIVDGDIKLWDNYGYDSASDSVLIFDYTNISDSEKTFWNEDWYQNILDTFRIANTTMLNGIGGNMRLGEIYETVSFDVLRENGVTISGRGEDIRVSVWPTEEQAASRESYIPLSEAFAVDSRELGIMERKLRGLTASGALAEGVVEDAELSRSLSAVLDDLITAANERRAEIAFDKVDLGQYQGAAPVLRLPPAPVTPEPPASQIGKRASAEFTPDKKLRVIDSAGKEHILDLLSQGTLHIDGLAAHIRDSYILLSEHERTILFILSLIEQSPPEMFKFDTLIEDLFGVASPTDNAIAVHESLANNPVALFHEIAEYLVRSGALEIDYDSSKRVVRLTDPKDRASAINVQIPESDIMVFRLEGWWDKERNDIKAELAARRPHYCLRILQHEIFTMLNFDITLQIQKAQRLKEKEQVPVTAPPAPVEYVARPLADPTLIKDSDVNNILVFAPNDKLGESVIDIWPLVSSLHQRFPKTIIYVATDYPDHYFSEYFGGKVRPIPTSDLKTLKSKPWGRKWVGYHDKEWNEFNLENMKKGMWLKEFVMQKNIDMIFDVYPVAPTFGKIYKEVLVSGKAPYLLSLHSPAKSIWGYKPEFYHPKEEMKAPVFKDRTGREYEIAGFEGVLESVAPRDELDTVGRSGVWQYAVEMCNLLGLDVSMDRLDVLKPTIREKSTALTLLKEWHGRQNGFAEPFDPLKKIFVINVYAKNNADILTNEGWALLIRRLLEETDAYLVFTHGGEDEVDPFKIERIFTLLDTKSTKMILVPRQDIYPAISDIFGIADWIITPDTGPAHLASGVYNKNMLDIARSTAIHWGVPRNDTVHYAFADTTYGQNAQWVANNRALLLGSFGSSMKDILESRVVERIMLLAKLMDNRPVSLNVLSGKLAALSVINRAKMDREVLEKFKLSYPDAEQDLVRYIKGYLDALGLSTDLMPRIAFVDTAAQIGIDDKEGHGAARFKVKLYQNDPDTYLLVDRSILARNADGTMSVRSDIKEFDILHEILGHMFVRSNFPEFAAAHRKALESGIESSEVIDTKAIEEVLARLMTLLLYRRMKDMAPGFRNEAIEKKIKMLNIDLAVVDLPLYARQIITRILSIDDDLNIYKYRRVLEDENRAGLVISEVTSMMEKLDAKTVSVKRLEINRVNHDRIGDMTAGQRSPVFLVDIRSDYQPEEVEVQVWTNAPDSNTPEGTTWHGIPLRWVSTENGNVAFEGSFVPMKEGNYEYTIRVAPKARPIRIQWDKEWIWLAGPGQNKHFKVTPRIKPGSSDMSSKKAQDVEAERSAALSLQKYFAAKNAGHEEAAARAASMLAAGEPVLLEFGCGNANIAHAIAMRNRSLNVIATDAYNAEASPEYGNIARSWERAGLEAQQDPLPNLAIVRSELDILKEIPDDSLDYILIVNPSDGLLSQLVNLLDDKESDIIAKKLKPGGQLIVKHFDKFSDYAFGGATIELLRSLETGNVTGGAESNGLILGMINSTKFLGADLYAESGWRIGSNKTSVVTWTKRREKPGSSDMSKQKVSTPEAAPDSDKAVRTSIDYRHATAGIARKPVDIPDAIREVQQMLEPAYSKKVRFDMDISEKFPQAMISSAFDEYNLRDLMRMVLVNAMYFRAHVTVRAFITPDGRPALSISDDGPGVNIEMVRTVVRGLVERGKYESRALTVAQVDKMSDEEVLLCIFDKHVTTKDRPDFDMIMGVNESQGRGIGLAAVAGIMERSHGEIHVETKKEAGTTFTFIFEPAPAQEIVKATSPEPLSNTPEAAVVALLKEVRAPGDPRIFFVPIKDANKAPYHTARADIEYAFEQEGFKNIRIIFYDDTETGLEEAVAKEAADPTSDIYDPNTLALAYVNANKMSKDAVTNHNMTHTRFKWIREDLPEGVPAGELFMHVAFGLPVLDYVKNSSDPEQKQRLMEIVEKLSGNDRKDLDLIKADFDKLFVSGFVLILKKITKIDINKEMHERLRTLTQVLTAA